MVNSSAVTNNSGDSFRVRRNTGRRLLLILALTCYLLLPAFWNYYPFIFPDTVMYLKAGLGLRAEITRSNFYSWFLSLAIPFGSLWPVIFLQSWLASWIIITFAEVFGFRPSWKSILVGLLLIATSSLPWQISYVMPDHAIGLLVLLLILLIFKRQALTSFERYTFQILAVFYIGCHSSNFSITTGLLALAFFLAFFSSARKQVVLNIGKSAALIMIAGLLISSINYAFFRKFAIAPRSAAFVLARLLSDGPGVWYLNAACPTENYAICPFRNSLKVHSDNLLWSDVSPMHIVTQSTHPLRDQYELEYQEIATNTIKRYTQEVIVTALTNTALQFFLVNLDEIAAPKSWLKRYFWSCVELFPGYDFHFAILHSRQFRTLYMTERSEFRHVNWLMQWSAALSGLILFFIIMALMDRNRGQKKLLTPTHSALVLLLATLFLNALVLGSLSLPTSRYQLRVIWLLQAALLLGIKIWWQVPPVLRESGVGEAEKSAVD